MSDILAYRNCSVCGKPIVELDDGGYTGETCLGNCTSWQARAEKSEAEVERLRADLKDAVHVLDCTMNGKPCGIDAAALLAEHGIHPDDPSDRGKGER